MLETNTSDFPTAPSTKSQSTVQQPCLARCHSPQSASFPLWMRRQERAALVCGGTSCCSLTPQAGTLYVSGRKCSQGVLRRSEAREKQGAPAVADPCLSGTGPSTVLTLNTDTLITSEQRKQLCGLIQGQGWGNSERVEGPT